MLAWRVLGPLEVLDGGTRIDLGGPLPRRLVATQLAAEGHAVSDDRLAEAMWDGEPPPQPAVALQAYVSRLRRALGRDTIVRSGAGYQLSPDPTDSTDAAEFVAAIGRGQAQLENGQQSAAVTTFTNALALWRGDPYADLPDAGTAGTRLRELREVAVEERLAARLGAGDAPNAVAELEAAVKAEPYRERRWALLILGLYRSGRQAEALAALRRVRALLADELGVDPGPDLQQLEQRVLGQDPQLLLAEPRPSPPTGHRLSKPISSFVGRERDVATLTNLLTQQRLVTLVGPAGVGKTRLTVEYTVARDDHDGPWFVRLADVQRPDVVVPAVAEAIGLAGVTGDPLPLVVRALAETESLLVLDNCEHLVDPVATLAIELLNACPGLTILATSREPLDVDGESVLQLAPLEAAAAVTLLVDRVRAMRPGWRPTDDELDEAHQLCAALDGVPLALELAAARTRTLSLGEITERLGNRFALLGSVPRGSLAPHATLETAIAWSVDLLSPTDRAFLLRLWPFEGGFSLDAAEAVWDGTGSALGSLSSLVSRSVVVADTTSAPARYRLLETIRAYCQATDPEPDATREAHAAWVRTLTARCPELMQGSRGGWYTRLLTHELPNLRAGIQHDLELAPNAALRSLGDLLWFWVRLGHTSECVRLIDTAVAAAVDPPKLEVFRALLAKMSAVYQAGDLVTAVAPRDEMYAIMDGATDPEDVRHLGYLTYYDAFARLALGDFEALRDRARAAIDIGERLGDPTIVATGRMLLGTGLADADLVRSARELAAAHEVSWAVTMADLLLGNVLLERYQTGDRSAASDAQAALHRAVESFRQQESPAFAQAACYASVRLLALTGDPLHAARLFAAVERHAARMGIQPDWMGARRVTTDDPLAGLDPDERRAAEQAGRELSWSAMVDEISVLTYIRPD
ncbi:AfsR/SARP family transcriptional regulator [Tenggerimyces flavus]|uniref:BTAD domain-containing putative transcriptional regulator n=1 Tax=Tenggerimyces flavus TaxID=1708749 RepID=A0ABV7YK03_9ACTN|nr:BTAD domain-containing putative transcriptional regulator [Tenggerimyces flavus]MBM7784545.1 putative ATPase/DNA-binding SARP family transcriptional activator [Tenggerimyces flavus]